jgi:transposase
VIIARMDHTDGEQGCLIGSQRKRDGNPSGQPAGADRKRRLKAVDRQQMLLRTIDVDRLIPDDDPARAIWEFVGNLNLDRFIEKVQSVEGAAGRPALDPHLLVSLWVYSYSRGVSSARAIERLCGHDPAYQWLTGMEIISAHTLSNFRVAHGDSLRQLFEQVLALLSAEGLITFERVMLDGTRIRACAASSGFRTKERIEEHLQAARELVAALDRQDEEESSPQAKSARERAARERLDRLASALQQFEELEARKSCVGRVSTTDPESRVMKQPEGGSAPSYNVQIATDAAHSLIVDVHATQAGSDYRQLMPAMDRLEGKMAKVPAQVVVDGGYISSDNIVNMAQRGVDLIGPLDKTPRAAANARKSYAYWGVHADYEASKFRYDPETNTCVCPQGKRLEYDATSAREGTMRYRYKASPDDCRACPAKSLCCPRSRLGRSMERTEPRPEIAAFQAKMQTDEALAIYRTRSQIAEFPNLWLKAKHCVRQFRLRGLLKTQIECLWSALTYDIQHWIRLSWRPRLVAA